MKRYGIIIGILVLLAAGVCSYVRAKDILHVGVYAFNPLSDEADRTNLGFNTAVMMQDGLKDADKYNVRKIGEIQKYMDTLKRAQSGELNEDAVRELARKLKVDYLLVGSVFVQGGHGEYDARIVNVNNWTIVRAAGVSAKDPKKASSQLCKNINDKFTPDAAKKKEDETRDLLTIEVYKFVDDSPRARNAGYGEIISEIMNTELGSLDGLAVIERTHAQHILNEKKMEMIGVIESDETDEFKKRNVAYVVVGSLRVFDGLICVRYHIENVQDKRIIFQDYREVGSIGTLRPLIRFFSRKIDDALNNRIGTLSLDSRPQGATVLVDGENRGATPLTTSLDKGLHKVQVSYSGCETVLKEIEIRPRVINAHTVTLPAINLNKMSLALDYEKQGNCAQALEIYNEFLARYPNTDEYNDALYRKGHVLLHCMHRAQDSLNSFNELMRRYPDSDTRVEAFLGAAMACRELNNRNRARELCNVILTRFPSAYQAGKARELLNSL